MQTLLRMRRSGRSDTAGGRAQCSTGNCSEAEKLEGTTWYTTPASFVAAGSGTKFDVAYSIEFLDDGTAIVTSYDCYGEKGDYSRVEIMEEEEISWSIEGLSTLKLGDKEYSFRFHKQMDEPGRWYFEDGNLVAGKIYHPKDKWGYSEFE